MKINRISLCKERKKDEALFEKKKEKKRGKKTSAKGWEREVEGKRKKSRNEKEIIERHAKNEQQRTNERIYGPSRLNERAIDEKTRQNDCTCAWVCVHGRVNKRKRSGACKKWERYEKVWLNPKKKKGLVQLSVKLKRLKNIREKKEKKRKKNNWEREREREYCYWIRSNFLRAVDEAEF